MYHSYKGFHLKHNLFELRRLRLSLHNLGRHTHTKDLNAPLISTGKVTSYYNSGIFNS